MGRICGCSGLTGGQYLSECVTATHLEEVETFTARGTFQVQMKPFNSTLRAENEFVSFFFFSRNAVCALQGRSPKAKLQNSQSAQIPANGIIRINRLPASFEFVALGWLYYSCAFLFITVQHYV